LIKHTSIFYPAENEHDTINSMGDKNDFSKNNAVIKNARRLGGEIKCNCFGV
jgi:hypothetical protein